jgi:nitrite reductase/ring-hydroxylating ferredoxin subunit
VKAFAQSWYPLCFSREIKAGEKRAFRAFDRDWLLFRGSSGDLGLIQLACPHAGASLEKSAVCGDRVICPLHAWEIATNGKTGRSSTTGEEIRSETLPVEEYAGIIYCFWGAKPLFPLPKRWTGEELVVSKVWACEFSAPHEMGGINAFDIQHMGPVHHRKILAPPTVTVHSPFHISLRYQAEISGNRWRDRIIRRSGLCVLDVDVHSHGGNILTFYHNKVGVTAYVSLRPIDVNKTKVIVSLTRRRDSRFIPRYIIRPFHIIQDLLIQRFAMEDLEVVNGAQILRTHWTPQADAPLIQWWKHYENMPKRPLEIC